MRHFFPVVWFFFRSLSLSSWKIFLSIYLMFILRDQLENNDECEIWNAIFYIFTSRLDMNIYLTNDINISATKITVHTQSWLLTLLYASHCRSIDSPPTASIYALKETWKKRRCDRHIQATKTRKLCKPLQKLDAVEWNNFHSTEKCTTPCYMPNTVEWRLQHIICILHGTHWTAAGVTDLKKWERAHGTFFCHHTWCVTFKRFWGVSLHGFEYLLLLLLLW